MKFNHDTRLLPDAEVVVLERVRWATRAAWLGCNNNNFNLNTNNNLNNNNAARGIAHPAGTSFIHSGWPLNYSILITNQILLMKTCNDLYGQLCSYDNLHLAFRKARKHKTLKDYVVEFEKDLKNNLLQLRLELMLHSYRPEPLKTFVLRDPKTRTISKSAFRDRVVHHALCNIIEPILSKPFIHDSYANRKGKGTLAAIQRFERFKRKVSRNHTIIRGTPNIKGFVLKADIKKYFDTVSHNILVNIIRRRIRDRRVIWLIRVILANHKTSEAGRGMPLGNLTSQFFANVYLNELDQYVKHSLKARYYIRYVDDFVILHRSRETLEEYREDMDRFLRETLDLQLHPDKSRIFPLYKGTTFLGTRIYARHRLLARRNMRKFKSRYARICREYRNHRVHYDGVYNFLEGWIAYSRHVNLYNYRRDLMKTHEKIFGAEISTKEVGRILKNTTCESRISLAFLT